MARAFDTDLAALRAAWQEAASNLGVRISIEDAWLTDAVGTHHGLVAIVHDFGGENGMAILPTYEPTLAELARQNGYGSTVLAAGYETFDRDLFVDTLNEWQWCGASEPPPWYTGAPWTE